MDNLARVTTTADGGFNPSQRLSLRYTNDYGYTIYMGQELPFPFLYADGLDTMDAAPTLIKSPYQLGMTSLGNVINERTITLYCALWADNEQEAERLRRIIIKAFNPTIKGKLDIMGISYEREALDVEVEKTPIFKDTEYRTFNNIQYWQVRLILPSAFLTDKYNTAFFLSNVTPLIEFPFEVLTENPEHADSGGNVYPPGDWFEFGTLNKGEVVYVNDSDAPLPILVEIKGPVQTPKITNKTTGEFIEIYVPILANETMYISTTFSDKSVIIVDENGVERNAFHYINLNSTFWQLVVGTNVVAFDAEAGNDTADITVYFKRRWTGI